MKLLAWGLLILVVLWLLRSKKSTGSAAASASTAATPGTESMVRCVHCGVYVPASEAIAAASGAAYCSEEHRLRHAS